MRNAVAILVLVAFFLGLLSFVIASALIAPMPAMASETVSQYLRSQGAGGAEPLIVRQAARASRPDRFTANYSSISVGDSLYFGIGRSFTPFVPPDPRLSITPAAGTSAYRGGRPLPYPPREVWCLLLAREGQGSEAVAFVALHQDMYNAQWVIHEAVEDGTSPSMRARLAALGCELG